MFYIFRFAPLGAEKCKIVFLTSKHSVLMVLLYNPAFKEYRLFFFGVVLVLLVSNKKH